MGLRLAELLVFLKVCLVKRKIAAEYTWSKSLITKGVSISPQVYLRLLESERLGRKPQRQGVLYGNWHFL
jgi:hypothetical protein